MLGNVRQFSDQLLKDPYLIDLYRYYEIPRCEIAGAYCKYIGIFYSFRESRLLSGNRLLQSLDFPKPNRHSLVGFPPSPCCTS